MISRKPGEQRHGVLCGEYGIIAGYSRMFSVQEEMANRNNVCGICCGISYIVLTPCR